MCGAFLPSTLSSLKLSSWLSSSHSPLFSVHIHTRGARPQRTLALRPTKQGTDLLYPCCLLVTSPHLPRPSSPQPLL